MSAEVKSSGKDRLEILANFGQDVSHGGDAPAVHARPTEIYEKIGAFRGGVPVKFADPLTFVKSGDPPGRCELGRAPSHRYKSPFFCRFENRKVYEQG